MASDRPQFRLKNALAYPVGLGLGVYGSLHLMTGFEYGLTEMPLRATGYITLAYSLAYALNPVLYDFGPAIRRLERRGRKTILTATGARTIKYNTHTAALPRSKKTLTLQVKQPGTIIATRDVIFHHNGKAISGEAYSNWLTRGYAHQLRFANANQKKSGLSRKLWTGPEGELSQPQWRRFYDILQYTVEVYSEWGILLAESFHNSFILLHKPGVIYDYTCKLLLKD